MLFCLLEYLQILVLDIWKTFEKKMQAYFSRKRGGGGGFFFFTDPKCMEEGEQGQFSVSFEEIFSSQGCKQL